jgi:predicted flap endonuclease-1-like 5' DNA nuclease
VQYPTQRFYSLLTKNSYERAEYIREDANVPYHSFFTTVYSFFFQVVEETSEVNWALWVILFLAVVAIFALLLWNSRRHRVATLDDKEIVMREAGVGSDMIPQTGPELADDEVILPPDEVVEQGHLNDPEVLVGERDDLTAIEGIGPAMQEILFEAGIDTYQKLAEADPVLLKGILYDLGLRFIDPRDWPGQARMYIDEHRERR